MATTTAETDTAVEHLDVLIVGAGISGTAAAYYLQRDSPERSYAILEMRDATGGTWDLFRYPGIRSDSDLHTFGYQFRPWKSATAIADGASIREYIRDTQRTYHLDDHIRLHHKVRSAAWDSDTATWTVTVERTDTGATELLTANFLFCASGYYDYEKGFSPEFPGIDSFDGPVIHPQQWPEDLDYDGKKVVVIGSGATAVTLIPAMADRTEHITMLQRSPSYILSLPTDDPVMTFLAKWIGPGRAFKVTRWKNIHRQQLIYRLSRRYPDRIRQLVRWMTVKQLPEGYPVDVDFKPKYDPWDQRLCLVPSGDLFATIRSGKGSVVTDTIDTFVPEGIRLQSGRTLEADIVVTATGLNILSFGGIDFTVDGEPQPISEMVAFRSAMLSGLPNLVYAIGYTNASWTLKVDLVCQYFTRMLAYMDEHGQDTVVAHPTEGMATRPLIDFAAGYVQRALDRLPRQGEETPWDVLMSYGADAERLREGPVTDPGLRFSASPEGPDRTGDETLVAA